jgi:hypothetical protein
VAGGVIRHFRISLAAFAAGELHASSRKRSKRAR